MNRSERRRAEQDAKANARFLGRYDGETQCDRCGRTSELLLGSPPTLGWFCPNCHAAMNPLYPGQHQIFAPDWVKTASRMVTP